MSESRKTRKLDEATDLVASMIPSLAAPLVLAAADDAILGKAEMEFNSPKKAAYKRKLEFINQLSQLPSDRCTDLKLHYTTEFIMSKRQPITTVSLSNTNTLSDIQSATNPLPLLNHHQTYSSHAANAMEAGVSFHNRSIRKKTIIPSDQSATNTSHTSNEIIPENKNKIIWHKLDVAIWFKEHEGMDAMEQFDTYRKTNLRNFTYEHRGKVSISEKQDGIVLAKCYRCKIGKEKKRFGECRLRIVMIPSDRISNNTNSHDVKDNTTKTKQYARVECKLVKSKSCSCSVLDVSRGLPPAMRNQVDLSLKLDSSIKPSTVSRSVLIQTQNSGPTSAQHREKVAKQVHRRIKTKKNEESGFEGHLPYSCATVGQLETTKAAFTFTPPPEPIGYLDSEDELCAFGKVLFDKKHLKVWGTPSVPTTPENSYRMMTSLSPELEGWDTTEHPIETELRKYVDDKILLKASKEKIEGTAKGNTVIFSSLSLLWNICQCKKIDFEVVASADGTDKISKSFSVYFIVMLFSNHSQ